MTIRKEIYHFICTSAHLHICTLLLILICSQRVVAGDFIPVDSIGVKNIDGKKFILYKIDHQETWFRISRKYGVSVKSILEANKDALNKPLAVGQIVFVPINPTPGPAIEPQIILPEGKPIIYKVKKKETLYSISVKTGQTMREIRLWSKLKTDNLQAGQKLIVGFENKKKEKQPAVGSQHAADSSRQSAVGNEHAIAIKKNLADTIKAAAAIKKETKDEWKNQAGQGRGLEERGMASFIEDQDINPTNYYALHRTARKGTIIKVTNIMNKKVLYVKVIGTLPDTGDNNDLVIKISKASAAKLGVLDSRFQVILNYFGE